MSCALRTMQTLPETAALPMLSPLSSLRPLRVMRYSRSTLASRRDSTVSGRACTT